jgi:hypothetical protein
MTPIHLNENHPPMTSYWMTTDLWMKFFSNGWQLDDNWLVNYIYPLG